MRRQARVALSVAAAMAVLLSLFAAQASADYVQIGTFADDGSGPGGSGSSAGQLSNPGQADVRSSNGRLYVADTGNNRVQVFAPSPTGGEYATQEAIASPTGLAIDQSNGDVYVAGPGGISKLDAALSPVGGFTDPGATGNLAVDPTTGDFLVADTTADLVRRYNSDGTADGSFAAARPIDVAVTSSGSILVVTSTGPMPGDCSATSAVEKFSGVGVSEGTIGASLTAVGAVAVDPDDGTIAISSNINERFCFGEPNPQVTFFDASGSALEYIDLGSATHYSSVPGLALAGNSSGRAYAVLEGPENDGLGITGIVAMEAKEKAPIPAAWVKSVSNDSAQVRGEINPEGITTTYHFEYGPADCSLSSCTSYPVPEASLEAGLQTKAVGALITGLDPDTTYHYLLAATNKYGTTESEDATFTTNPAEIAGPPLPEGRVYEMVSPVEKGDYDIAYGSGYPDFGGSFTLSSNDGNSVGFNSFGAFANPKGSPITNQYIGDRTPNGWVTRAVSALQEPSLVNFERFDVLSEDLTRGVQEVNHVPSPFDKGLYLTELSDGSLEEIVPFGAGLTGWVDGTPSFDRIVLGTLSPLLPEAEGKTGVYEFSSGQLSLLSFLPNGEVATDARLGATAGLSIYERISRSVSADASRVFFEGIDPGVSAERNVYLREGTTTTWVSASQRTVPDSSVAPAVFQGASEDGRYAFFTSATKLTNDAVANLPAFSADLYMYDVETGGLTDLTTADPNGGGMAASAGDDQGGGVWGVSPDGSLVYFTSKANLTPGTTGSNVKFYVYDNSDGSTTLIAPVTVVVRTKPMVSNDGSEIAFLTRDRIGSYENRNFSVMYRYDHDTGALDCISCNPSGASPTEDVEGTPPILGTYVNRMNRQPRIISQDGETLAFTSKDQLVPADRNGVNDAYLYRDGEVHLISSGLGKVASQLADMSPDGHDLFFTTRDRLVGIDRDNAYDLYDARVGGGIAAQNPGEVTPCSGSECQGPQSAPPASPVLGTEAPGGAPCHSNPRKANKLSKQATSKRKQAAKAKPARAKKLRKQANNLQRQSKQARSCKGGGK